MVGYATVAQGWFMDKEKLPITGKGAEKGGLAPKWIFLATITPVFLLLDQLAKWLVFNRIGRAERIELIPGLLQLGHVHNTGMVFGQLSRMPPWFFIILSGLAFVVVFFLFRQITEAQKTLALSVSFILAGALGNLIDRARLGFVIDFIDMHIGSHHWPSYNVADITICIGAGLLVIEMWRKPPPGAEKDKAEQE